MKATITRFYKYRDALVRFERLGLVKVFSDNLAEAVGSTSAQVRKDFSLFGITGQKRGGYGVRDLLGQLDAILGKDKAQEVVLVGCGRIGKALMHYGDFAKEGIVIKAGFDTDTRKVRRQGALPILPLEELPAYVRKQGIILGILAVPEEAAQGVVDRMVAAGMRGVLNFAPVELKVPPEFYLSNVNLRLELEILNYFVNASGKRGGKPRGQEGAVIR